MKTLLSTLALACSLAVVGCASTGATTGAAAEKKAECDDPNCKGDCDDEAKKDDCGGDCDKGAKQTGVVPADAIGTEATCPVSGEKHTVTADTAFSTVEGKNVYFCCPGCKKKFDADPSAFAK